MILKDELKMCLQEWDLLGVEYERRSRGAFLDQECILLPNEREPEAIYTKNKDGHWVRNRKGVNTWLVAQADADRYELP